MKVPDKYNHAGQFPEMITNLDKFPEGLRILGVDDDPVCLKVVQSVLLRCHYKVTVTNKAVNALKILRENKNNFDIVLTEVHMLDMDGFRLLEIIGLEMDIPVIMMSSNDDQATVMKCIEYGACDYLLKPIQLDVIKNIWQHVIRKNIFDNNYLVQLQALHKKFIHVYDKLGPDISSKILEEMNEPNLTCEQIANHLIQNYRTPSNKIGGQQQNNRIGSNGMNEHLTNAAVLSSNNQGSNGVNQLNDFRTNSPISSQMNQFGHYVHVCDKLGPNISSKILEEMNEPNITGEQIASHLQKYRTALKRTGGQQKNNYIGSNGTNGLISSQINVFDHYDENGSTQRKQRVVWNTELHKKFIHAYNKLGPDKSVPSKILEEMNEPNLTLEQIASHLQKYRTALKKTGGQQKNNYIGSNGTNGLISSQINVFGHYDENGSTQRKQRVAWNTELHKKFIHAYNKLGPDKSVPSKILKEMNEPNLTLEQIASHLQKYRTALKKTGGQQKNNYIGSNGTNGLISSQINVVGHHVQKPNTISHSFVNPLSCLPLPSQPNISSQQFPNNLEVLDEYSQMIPVYGPRDIYSNSVRMENSHHQNCFNRLSQSSSSRTNLRNGVMGFSSRMSGYNASNEPMPSSLPLSGCTSNSFPVNSFDFRDYYTFNDANLSNTSLPYQNYSGIETVQETLPGLHEGIGLVHMDMQNSNVEYPIRLEELSWGNFFFDQLDIDSFITSARNCSSSDDDDFNAVVKQLQSMTVLK